MNKGWYGGVIFRSSAVGDDVGRGDEPLSRSDALLLSLRKGRFGVCREVVESGSPGRGWEDQGKWKGGKKRTETLDGSMSASSSEAIVGQGRSSRSERGESENECLERTTRDSWWRAAVRRSR